VESAQDFEKWVNVLRELQETVLVQLRQANSWMREMKKNEKEGFLWKKGGLVKNWKHRWFLLRDGFLYYYKIDSNGVHVPRGSISLYGSTVECSNEFPTINSAILEFEIVTASRVYALYADTDSDTKEWISAIRNHKRDIEVKLESMIFEEPPAVMEH